MQQARGRCPAASCSTSKGDHTQQHSVTHAVLASGHARRVERQAGAASVRGTKTDLEAPVPMRLAARDDARVLRPEPWSIQQ